MAGHTSSQAHRVPSESPTVLSYHAFISYSHAGERDLARSIQLALEAVARPLFRQRSMRVFRDDTNLAANPNLWGSIENAIDASRVLVLLASPKGARSVWIPREVSRFVERRGRDLVCIAVASGVTPWTRDEPPDAVLAREDAAVSPDVYQLLSVPDRRPLVVDFSPFVPLAHEERIASTDFQSRIASVAALVLGRDKDVIYNEHIARQRRVIRIATAAVAILLSTAAFAGWQAIRAQRAQTDALHERNIARQQRDAADTARSLAEVQRARADTQRAIADTQRTRARAAERRATEERDAARSQAIANGAYALAERDPTVALQLARLSDTTGTNAAAAAALVRAFNTGSWFYSHRLDGAWDADLSEDGRRLVVLDGQDGLRLFDLETGAASRAASSASSVRILSNGNLVLWSGWNGVGTKGFIELRTPSGGAIARHELESLNALVCRSGEILVPAFADDRSVAVQVINPASGAVRPLTLPRGINALGSPNACLPGRGGIAVAQTIPGALALASLDGRQRLLDIPSGYHAVDIAVDEQRGRVAVYLAGARQGVTDAIGWVSIEESLRSGAALTILPLPISPGFDSGGRICFLPDGRR